MPIAVKPKPKSQSAAKSVPAKIEQQRANRNPHEFAQDVAFLEHCASIYGEENFLLAFQALRPLKEKYQQQVDMVTEKSVFSEYDEKWWFERELNQVFEQIEKAKEPAEPQVTAQKPAQKEAIESSALDDNNVEADYFMPQKIPVKFDFNCPFEQTALKIKQLNDGKVCVIGDKSREVIKSRILSAK